MSDEQREKAGSPWGPANPQALNRYSYVQNNPLRWTDPTGHFPCYTCSPIFSPKLAMDVLNWVGDTWSGVKRRLAQEWFSGGGAIIVTGADGIARTIRSAVKQNPGLYRAAGELTKRQSKTAENLINRFLNGQESPGLGRNGHLDGTDVFYLRARDNARVFMRQVGKDSYEIVGYANYNSEDRVIRLLLELYSK